MTVQKMSFVRDHATSFQIGADDRGLLKGFDLLADQQQSASSSVAVLLSPPGGRARVPASKLQFLPAAQA